MKIGLYGGTFDPIHKGHILPVREARRVLGLDQVIYMPTAQPPHKGTVTASAEARFAMVELALLWEPGMVTSTFEITRPGPTYTIDSVNHLRTTRPDDEIVLIVGSDAFATFDAWRSWQEILEQVPVAVMMRPGWDRVRLAETLSPELAQALTDGRARYIDNRPVAVSSSEIRRQVRDGNTPSPIPRLVLDYIRKYALYR